MLNQKFASIRANSKNDKRSSSVTHHDNQRLSQSQSMEMPKSYQHAQKINNSNILMNLSKGASARSSFDRRGIDFSSSAAETPVRSPATKPFGQHPYVNLMHQQPQPSFNDVARYQLQYQNNVSMESQSNPDSMHKSWNLPSPTQPIPLTHYTAAQIYMRPKVNVSPYPSAYSSVSKKPPPPEVPKRLSSTISIGSTSSLKKNELSRSSRKFNCCN